MFKLFQFLTTKIQDLCFNCFNFQQQIQTYVSIFKNTKKCNTCVYVYMHLYTGMRVHTSLRMSHFLLKVEFIGTFHNLCDIHP